MSAIPQQVLNSQKAAIDTFVAVQTSMFSGFEKFVDLNLKVMKATLDEVSEKSQQVASIKDAQEAVAMSSNMAQPATEKAMSYSKHVYDIMSGVQADLAVVHPALVLAQDLEPGTGQRQPQRALVRVPRQG